MEAFQQDTENSLINADKSEYELLRELKIARNQRRLAELGLLNLGTDGKKPTKRKHPGHTSSESKQKPKGLPRRSERLRLSVTTQKTSGEEEDNQVEIPSSSSTELVIKKINSHGANRQNLKIHQPVILTGEKVSTRFLYLNVNEMLSQFLGQKLEMGGKDFVISQISRYSSLKETNEMAGIYKISFSKYSGVLEWKNAIRPKHLKK